MAPRLDIVWETGRANLNIVASGSIQTQDKDRVDPLTDPSTAAMREQLLSAADKTVTLDFVEMPLADAISYLSDLTNIRFVIHQPAIDEIGEKLIASPITLRLQDIPFSSALTALQDQVPWLRLVVRPYGVLLTAERGEPIGSFTIEQLYHRQKLAPAADATK